MQERDPIIDTCFNMMNRPKHAYLECLKNKESFEVIQEKRSDLIFMIGNNAILFSTIHAYVLNDFFDWIKQFSNELNEIEVNKSN